MATLITPDGTETEVYPANGQAFTLKELQEHVNGYIEGITIDNGSRRMYVNEDGKVLGLRYNAKATKLFHQAGGYLPDHIVGNALIE